MDEQRVLCVLGCRSTALGGPFPAAQGYLTCRPCAARLRQTLLDIPDRYATILGPEALEPYRQDLGRRPTGFASNAPVSLHILALRDPRSTWREPGDPHNALNVLWWWATQIRELRGHTPPQHGPTVHSECGTLLFEWDWITRQALVTGLARDLRETAAQLAHAMPGGEPPPHCVGTCTTILSDGIRCKHPLYLPKTGKKITCGGCGHTYNAADLITLNLTQRRSGT
jgi:hypothetical protein